MRDGALLLHSTENIICTYQGFSSRHISYTAFSAQSKHPLSPGPDHEPHQAVSGHIQKFGFFGTDDLSEACSFIYFTLQYCHITRRTLKVTTEDCAYTYTSKEIDEKD